MQLGEAQRYACHNFPVDYPTTKTDDRQKVKDFLLDVFPEKQQPSSLQMRKGYGSIGVGRTLQLLPVSVWN